MGLDMMFALSDTGGGHRSVASALIAGIEELASGPIRCTITDLLVRTALPFLKNAPRVYDSLTTRHLRLYNTGFAAIDSAPRIHLLSRLVYPLVQKELVRTLVDASPKLVVVTHPFLIGHLVCRARREHGLGFRVVTVVTDPVSIHAAWACPDVDSYIVFGKAAGKRLEALGISPKDIATTSFPVHPDFCFSSASKQQARELLTIHPKQFTVLITGGGAGSGIDPVLVERLARDPTLQILLVSGSNKSLYHRIMRVRRSPNVRVYGRVQNMPTLMAACDLVITKAGPSTLMEAAAMNRPVIVTGAIGPQEVGNLKLVSQGGLGVICDCTDRVISAVAAIRAHGWSVTASDTLAVGRSAPAGALLRVLGKTSMH